MNILHRKDFRTSLNIIVVIYFMTKLVKISLKSKHKGMFLLVSGKT